jgi:small-conductance mechanosensitive channel
MFSISQTTQHLLIVAIIIIGSYLLAKFLKYLLRKYLDSLLDLQESEKTNYNFFKHTISFIIFLVATIGIFYTIPTLKELGLTLLASAGLVAAVLGLAAQQAFSNIISGVFIVIFKPFRVGDLVEIADKRGIVEDITLRHTVIKNVENKRLIIPNATISNDTIINASIKDPRICNLLELGISYDSDIKLAMSIIQKEAIKHPNCIDNRTEEQKENGEPIVVVRLLGYGESSINLRAYIWSVDSLNGFIMKSDLFESIKDEFDKNNIEIPFPYRTIVYKNKAEDK